MFPSKSGRSTAVPSLSLLGATGRYARIFGPATDLCCVEVREQRHDGELYNAYYTLSEGVITAAIGIVSYFWLIS